MDFPWLLYELAATGQVVEDVHARLGQRTKVGGLYLLSAIEGIAHSEEGFAASKAAWANVSHQFQSGRLLEAARDLGRAALTEGLDVSHAAGRLRQALASAKHAPNELFRNADPLVSLGALFIVASLMRYGQLPPELRYDPGGQDLTVE